MTVLTPNQIAQLARTAGFPESSVKMAVAVALAESGGNTEAHGDNNNPHRGCGSYGLWQINSCPDRDTGSPTRFGGEPSRLYDPATNAKSALAISSGGTNWAPWSTKAKAIASLPKLKIDGTGVDGSAEANPVPSPSNSSSNSAGEISLTSAGTWLRVAQFVGGVVVIMVGASLIGVDIFGAVGGIATKGGGAVKSGASKLGALGSITDDPGTRPATVKS